MAFKLIKNDTKQDSQILKGLNGSQYEAVTATEGPVLVVAGAGSGKTRVLTHRIAYLIENGIPPGKILALTFTNKAAEEMKERIARLLSFEVASKVWAGTFHSIFARILRIEAQFIGFTSAFSIYDADDALAAIRTVMGNMKLSTSEVQPQMLRSRISWSKNQMISWQEFSRSAESFIDKQTSLVYEGYDNYLRQNNAMDFDDLLNNFIHLLKNNQQILDKYQEIFRYILVDEYQDTNRSQYVATKLLAQKYRNICVVGDDAQSIYRWRGADIKNILEFQKDFENAGIIRLEQNYRSTKNIIGAAGSVIKNNHRQIPKTLWTDNPEGEKIDIINCYDDEEEADKIIARITKYKNSENYTNKDFAILYRTNAQSLAFENVCRRMNLPYIVLGGMSFYKRKEVKDTLSYLRVLVNSSDNESLLRIINEPPRGIGPTSMAHVKLFAYENQITLLEAFQNCDKIETLQTRAKNAVKAFVDSISKFLSLNKELAPDQLARDFVHEMGLVKMYEEIGTEEALDRVNNIEQVLNDITKFISNNPEKDLVDYIQQISLVSDIDEKDMSMERIKLMTLHSAKGLEFPVVFIAGLEQGLFPLTRIDSHSEELEEERRLFYVGITRAMKNLHLSHCQRRLRYGEYQKQTKSSFLKEIDPIYLKGQVETKSPPMFGSQIKPKPQISHSYFSDIPAEENYSQIEPDGGKIRKGAKVTHPQFGNGTVEALAGIGSATTVTVYFQSVGRKKLMLNYAKLTVIG